MTVNQETALNLYRTIMKIRKFENMMFLLFSTRQMPGTMHQYNGQEAVAAGVCANLKKSDYITSTHRGHGHCIAKGADINAVMAEMFARTTGCCKGMGGSMHIADFTVGMLGANGIVGAGLPIATGAGLSCKLENKGRVSVAFFGDGASNEGSFHESLNLASAWKLPVLFVCENNLYGYSTHISKASNIENIADRAAAYGMTGMIADGMNVMEIFEKARDAISSIRKDSQPMLMECKTYRFLGHARFEKPNYRTADELAQWRKRDPVITTRAYLANMGVSEAVLNDIDIEIDNEIGRAVEFAENSPHPEPAEYLKYIFAGV
jgi:TPP-dependent pyruvate/acetoin dehydrogenase alpha subunit